MKNYRHEFPLERMAKVLGVSRSGYYRFLKANLSLRDQENERLLEKIRLTTTQALRPMEVLVSMQSLRKMGRLVPERE